ncbi:MAG: chemotaxis protein CheX [Burkholderiales bacterium]|jgi:non-heme Fe2+,alpha-ketoglutarate-dependent halogenase|nr:chemotaxis protein CheX [Burkholderiales bacterium]
MLSFTEKQRFFLDGVIGPFKIYESDEAKEILRKIRRKNLDTSKAIFDNDVNYDRHLDIEELAKHIINPSIIARLADIIGPDILCWRTEFFPKFPGVQGTEWHQVGNYQYANGIPMLEGTLGDDNSIMDLTVWTAFTDTTIETACMRFIPGTHKAKYYDEAKAIHRKETDYSSVLSETSFYGYNFEEFKINPNWLPEEQNHISIEMKAGECIIFTARCVHASHPNISKTFSRFAISARYVPTHVKVYPNSDKFYAHGAWFDLAKYGCVLVSGTDIYHHNRIREKDQNGRNFI